MLYLQPPQQPFSVFPILIKSSTFFKKREASKSNDIWPNITTNPRARGIKYDIVQEERYISDCNFGEMDGSNSPKREYL
jgi:hypothetical protein